MLILFELALQISIFQRIAILPFHKLFHSLCSKTLVYSYKHHNFLKQIIVLFVTKLHRILLNFLEICGNFKAQTKTEDEGILKKGKVVIFMIFAPPHYLSRVKGYSQLLLCEAPKYPNADICRAELFCPT